MHLHEISTAERTNRDFWIKVRKLYSTLLVDSPPKRKQIHLPTVQSRQPFETIYALTVTGLKEIRLRFGASKFCNVLVGWTVAACWEVNKIQFGKNQYTRHCLPEKVRSVTSYIRVCMYVSWVLLPSLLSFPVFTLLTTLTCPQRGRSDKLSSAVIGHLEDDTADRHRGQKREEKPFHIKQGSARPHVKVPAPCRGSSSTWFKGQRWH